MQLLQGEIQDEIAVKRAQINELQRKEDELELTIKRLKSQHNEKLAINRLPLEVTCLILKRLDYCDLLACEQTCELWNYFVKALNLTRLEIVKELRVRYKVSKIRPRKWFFLDSEQQVPSKAMRMKDLNFVVPENSFLIRLKYLRICDPKLKHSCPHNVNAPLLDDVKFLNRFVNLEMLEISRFRFHEDYTLSLPNLKHLAIHHPGSDLIVNCPKLTSFQTEDRLNNSDKAIQFLFPETITHVYLNSYWAWYEECKNLQHLSINSSNFSNESEKSDWMDCPTHLLNSFPKLTEISLRPDVNCSLNRKSFLELLKAKQQLGRTELKLIFYGILLNDPNQFEARDGRDDGYTSVYDFLSTQLVRNWTSVCENELKWFKVLDYCELMKCVDQQTDRIPADIHEKLCSVEEFEINDKVENEDHLIEFIRGFNKNLRYIKFHTESLPDEHFFERLAESCSSIPHLDLLFRGDHRRVINYDFVLNFKNLIGMKTWSGQLSKQREFIKKLFDKFDTFKLFNIEKGNHWVWIARKDRHSQFEYNIFCCRSELFDDLDDLMKLHDRRYKSGNYDYYGSADSDDSIEFSSTEDILKNFSTYRSDRRRQHSDSDFNFDDVQSPAGVFGEEEDQ